MGKNRRRTAQAPKRYTRLGASKVTQGMNTGGYIGGRDARVSQPVNGDE